MNSAVLKLMLVLFGCNLCFNVLGKNQGKNSNAGDDNLMSLSLAELSSIKVIQSSSLMHTSKVASPNTITLITQEDIKNSGARRVIDVLEIFVPNFQVLLHHSRPWHIGLRGIMGNNQQLWLVNGKNVKQNTTSGISPEMDLPTLGDIERIEVIRGSGSALHGPGAIGTVINIVTYSGQSFNGVEVNGKVGIVENFQMLELKGGKEFNENKGIFAYVGVSNMQGANHENAPFYISKERTINDNEYGPTDNVYDLGGNYRQSFDDKLKWKGHLEFNNKNLSIWFRNLNGGELHQHLTRSEEQSGYNYSNLNVKYTVNAIPKNTINIVSSGSNLLCTRFHFNNAEKTINEQYRESGIEFKLIDNIKLSNNLTLSLGSEYKLAFLGRNNKDSLLLPNSDMPRDAIQPWETNLFAVLAEVDYRISNNFQLVLGARNDWYTKTKNMFSPRATLLYSPSSKNTLKLMVARSSRMNVANDIRIDYEMHNRLSDVETLNSYEISESYMMHQNLFLGANIFYYDWKPLTYSPKSEYRLLIGSMKSGGFEIEIDWKKDNNRLRASHSYTKLIDADLIESDVFLHYTTAQVDGSHNFTYWNDHNTKFYAQYMLGKKVLLTTSANVLWGSPGGYNMAKVVSDTSYGYMASNYLLTDNAPFKPSLYLNIGGIVNLSKQLQFSANCYNTLGLFNENLNKRWIWNSGGGRQAAGAYRIQPVSFSIAATYKFNKE